MCTGCKSLFIAFGSDFWYNDTTLRGDVGMKYPDASVLRRFAAFLIDYFLLWLVANLLLSWLVYPLVGYDLANLLTEKIAIIGDHLYDHTLDKTIYHQVLILILLQFGWISAVMLPLIVLYLCVLPCFWEKQTLGRGCFGLRVVSVQEKKVGFLRLCLREISGYVLLGLFFAFLIVPLLFLAFFVFYTNRSISDYIARTRLISLRSTPPYPFHYFSDQQEKKRDFIDADVNSVLNQEESADDYKVL